LFTVKGGKT
jgi:hypothetical protein